MLVQSQWERSLQSNAASHWLGAPLKSALLNILCTEKNTGGLTITLVSCNPRGFCGVNYYDNLYFFDDASRMTDWLSWWHTTWSLSFMKMSCHGNTFRNIGPLWGESIYHRGIPFTKGQWCGALIFFCDIDLNELSKKQSNWDATCGSCDIILMNIWLVSAEKLFSNVLSHWGREKVGASLQTTLSNALSFLKKIFKLRLNFTEFVPGGFGCVKSFIEHLSLATRQITSSR